MSQTFLSIAPNDMKRISPRLGSSKSVKYYYSSESSEGYEDPVQEDVPTEDDFEGVCLISDDHLARVVIGFYIQLIW